MVHASEVVTADEPPSKALRNKKDSSMRVAINLVHEGKADACVSAGNTGALMATARFVLKTLTGIDRPAIISSLPTQNDSIVRMLDLGANVDCSAENLFQFAVMGSIVAQAISGIDQPRLGLLNVGAEENKGNVQVKETAELLTQCADINYIGYVEGDAIFSGDSDVIVCDGFVGNIALKTCEGLAKLIGRFVKDTINKDLVSRIASVPAAPLLRRLGKRLDPRRRNGATFVGLNGIVIKSHGGADMLAFISAIEQAMLEVEKNIPQRIRDKVQTIMKIQEP